LLNLHLQNHADSLPWCDYQTNEEARQFFLENRVEEISSRRKQRFFSSPPAIPLFVNPENRRLHVLTHTSGLSVRPRRTVRGENVEVI
jgi:hypothetical protein